MLLYVLPSYNNETVSIIGSCCRSSSSSPFRKCCTKHELCPLREKEHNFAYLFMDYTNVPPHHTIMQMGLVERKIPIVYQLPFLVHIDPTQDMYMYRFVPVKCGTFSIRTNLLY
jgi:hypothetical protein